MTTQFKFKVGDRVAVISNPKASPCLPGEEDDLKRNKLLGTVQTVAHAEMGFLSGLPRYRLERYQSILLAEEWLRPVTKANIFYAIKDLKTKKILGIIGGSDKTRKFARVTQNHEPGHPEKVVKVYVPDRYLAAVKDDPWYTGPATKRVTVIQEKC